MSGKWIIFKADDSHGWKDRKFAHSGGCTSILSESFDYTDKESPEEGYRVTERVRDASGKISHYRDSDWVVGRVDTFSSDIPLHEDIETVVICYCQYSPIDAPLKPMPDRIISADSFGGDEAKYQEYLNSQKVTAAV
jgi:hypothetical protein